MKLTIQEHVINEQEMMLALKDILASLYDNKAFDLYTTPFECKQILHKPYPQSVQSLIHDLRARYTEDWHQDDQDNHFTAVMIYLLGDYLLPHRDAEVHPVSKRIKTNTYLYFLTIGAPLVVNDITIPAVPNRLVTFNGGVPHHMPTHYHNEPRVVITFSDLSLNTNDNGLTKAYFLDQPRWSAELRLERDKRAGLINA